MKIDLLKKTEKELEREVIANFGKYELYDTNEDVKELLRAIVENNSEGGDMLTIFDMKTTRALLELMTNVLVIDKELLDLETLEKRLNKPSRNLRRLIEKLGRIASEDMCDIIEDIVANKKVVKMFNNLPKEVKEKTLENISNQTKESE